MAKVKITARQKAKIQKAVEALNDVRADIQSKNPDHDINWYLEDCGNFNLMENPSHDENHKARQDRVILHSQLEESSGGGW
jgi:hypothetical protein